jgi:hypothetical protein
MSNMTTEQYQAQRPLQVEVGHITSYAEKLANAYREQLKADHFDKVEFMHTVNRLLLHITLHLDLADREVTKLVDAGWFSMGEEDTNGRLGKSSSVDEST